MRKGFYILLVASMALVGCSKSENDGRRSPLDSISTAAGGGSTTAEVQAAEATCIATPSVSVVASGEAFDVQVQILVADFPVTLSGLLASTNESSVIVTGAIRNKSGLDANVERRIDMIDASGNKSYCTFEMTVQPE